MASSVEQGRRRIRPVAATLTATLALASVVALVGTAPATAAESSGAYIPIGPTRVADTREPQCGCSRVDASTIRVEITGRSDVPDDAIAVAVIVTATPTPTPGFVTAYPSGTTPPLASTLNTRADRVVANSAIVPIGTDGDVAVFSSTPGDIIVDITGAFVSTSGSAAGRFVPVAARRLVDTRDPGPNAGPIGPGGELTIPLPPEAASDAVALAVTVTSVTDEHPGYLATRPAGTAPNGTSFLNVNGSGQAVAATAIMPVSPAGLTIGALHRGHVIVDLLGWFTGPSAPVAETGLFVPIAPQRLLDTRATPPRVWPGGTVELPVPIAGAGSLITNVTATYADRAGFVTAFPAGTPLPVVSTLNPAMHDHTLANMAITQVSARGLAYFARSGADVIIDVAGMFIGAPIAATGPVAHNAPTTSRVLMVGDSTLATLPLYTDAQRAFVGFDAIVDVDNCRRLVRPSCLSPVTGRIPNTILEAVLGAPGAYDMVVVRAGYNDWNSDFPSEFDAVVQAARAKGAHTVIWMSYTAEWSESPNALRAYRENNADLFWLVTLPQYADVVLADLDSYTRTALPSWTWDGAHLTEYGTWLITDYIARFIAAIEHRPCPKPWGPGGPVLNPCPKPDVMGAVPDVIGLY